MLTCISENMNICDFMGMKEVTLVNYEYLDTIFDEGRNG